MPADSTADLRRRLHDLGARIERKLTDLHEQGASHGADREAAANYKLEHVRLAEDASSGRRQHGEIQTDLETLELTVERWLARIDKQARA